MASELPNRPVHDSLSHPAPPSSPPAMPPSSPLPTEPVLSRKRSRVDPVEDSSGSSDPALFSDDGLDRSLEDYTTSRRKRKYRFGTWWNHEEPMQKTEIHRNIDSGVWLPSDSSLDSDTAVPSETVSLQASPRRHRRLASFNAPTQKSPKKRTSVKLSRAISLSAGEDLPPISTRPMDPEAFAKSHILKCLDAGSETIDLMNVGLGSLSSETIRPLHSLIKYPHCDEDLPSSDAYQSFTPHIKMYLSSNSLKEVPQEMWRIENITVLTLRNNMLKQLSPAIAKLRNLIELNVSGNQLQWLPWELLGLLGQGGKLQKLTTTPNPFLQGVLWSPETIALTESRHTRPLQTYKGLGEEIQMLEEEISIDPSRDDLKWLLRLDKTIHERMLEDSGWEEGSRYPWKRDPIYICSSAISWIMSDGSLSNPRAKLPSSSLRDDRILPGLLTSNHPSSPPGDRSDRVPSLTEAALRCLSNLPRPQIETIPALFPEDTPHHVTGAVQTLLDMEDPAGKICSVCARKYVIERAEWVEYWHYVPDSMYCSHDLLFLPFLRRACSWGCALDARRINDSLEQLKTT